MRSFPADVRITSAVAPALEALGALMPPATAKRRKTVAQALEAERQKYLEIAHSAPAGIATNASISRALDRHKGRDAVVVGELGCDPSVMTFERADSYFGHPIAGGLGWGLPAALGVKLAAPDRLVVACVGDGSYMFANPVACHQTAEAMGLPVLTIVFNNEVWNAVRKSTGALYPKGHAAAVNDMPLSSLAPSPAYEKVIEASGGWGRRVEDPAELDRAMAEAISVVRDDRRQALLNVRCAIGG
jgi:acetolactate synthase-1/2/3 large subunit